MLKTIITAALGLIGGWVSHQVCWIKHVNENLEQNNRQVAALQIQIGVLTAEVRKSHRRRRR